MEDLIPRAKLHLFDRWLSLHCVIHNAIKLVHSCNVVNTNNTIQSK